VGARQQRVFIPDNKSESEGNSDSKSKSESEVERESSCESNLKHIYEREKQKPERARTNGRKSVRTRE